MQRRITAAALSLVLLSTPAFAGGGIASWYGPGFHGRTTASGERFNQDAATCAHKTLKFGTKIRVKNLRNGRTATCRINDRGPYSGGRVLDVSRGVARQLGMIRSGTARVSWTVIR